MSYLPQETALQQDILATKEDVLHLGEALNHLARVQAEAFVRFWNRAPERILAELNSDPGRYASLLSANTAIGVSANAQLSALNLTRFPNRALVAMPEGWSFSPETGFSYAAPEPEP
jgi:hypothetical protein